MTHALTKLCQQFTSTLAKKADTDALETYPGEDSSNQSKIEAAKQAVVDDMNHITSSYYMYQSQHEQSALQMINQRNLLDITKKIRNITDDLSDPNNIDFHNLNVQLLNIKNQAHKISESTGVRISLAELHSFRLLLALVQDESAKSLPKMPPPDWVELARIKGTPSSRMREQETLPATLRSPEAEVMLDSSELIEDD